MTLEQAVARLKEKGWGLEGPRPTHAWHWPWVVWRLGTPEEDRQVVVDAAHTWQAAYAGAMNEAPY